MVKTRSDDKDGCDKSELEEILQPLRQNFAEISKVIDNIEEKFDIDFKRYELQIKGSTDQNRYRPNLFAKQRNQIKDLQTRIDTDRIYLPSNAIK